MAKRYKMELWDMMQCFFTPYNDRMMHGAFYFDAKLDKAILKESITQAVTAVPILKCKFIKNPVRPYWEERPFDIDLTFFEKTITDPDEVEAFLCGMIDEESFPQIRFCLFEFKGQDILAVLINHMCFDGKCFKDFMSLLSEIYSGLVNDKSYIYASKISKNRSFETFFNSLTKPQLKEIKARSSHGMETAKKVGFPFSTHSEEERVLPKIIKSKLSAAKMQALRLRGKTLNATVNDILISALLKTVSESAPSILQSENNSNTLHLDIDCIVDLRRYLKPDQSLGYTNFVSKIICDIGDPSGLSFLEILSKVSKQMHFAKNNLPGVDGLAQLRLGYKILPFAFARKVVRKKYRNPLVAISNIGIIDEATISFAGITLLEAYITGSIKHNPYIQLALTTFRDEITFTIALFGTPRDYDTAQAMLTKIEDVINTFIS